MTNQPKSRLVANLGDADPISYGGYFVYRDTTGVYAPEAEYLEAEDDNGKWYAYRFSLDQCKLIEVDHTVYLVPERYAPTWPHAVSAYDEWFHRNLARVAESAGEDMIALRNMFCSADILERARAYRAIGEYHGFDNMDSYPLVFTARAEVTKRYRSELRTLRARARARKGGV